MVQPGSGGSDQEEVYGTACSDPLVCIEIYDPMVGTVDSGALIHRDDTMAEYRCEKKGTRALVGLVVPSREISDLNCWSEDLPPKDNYVMSPPSSVDILQERLIQEVFVRGLCAFDNIAA
ncbi:hypothetical protein L1987_16874 [Smallanthus sonchifolius]|uniref:Uncharacterized protein n=1 Tax=Smallanthus sonchifolius TaxID=185202 RepID=A0ACB9IVA4_9ASTR|nr:hypothetical protein L1987_16874 [Smallanthus sonchifolius]